jgi:rhamnosyl/mannosyltransferase
MKILHFGKYYPPQFGGIEKVNFDLVESLNKHGICTDVICFNIINKTVIDDFGYKVFRSSTLTSIFSTPLSFSIFLNLRKICNNYDIIHLHLPNPLATVALLLSGYNGKLVIHWHSDIVKQKKIKKIYFPFHKRILKKADRIIVTSKKYLKHSSDLEGFKDKCLVIPLGISKDDFTPNLKLRSELGEKYEGKKVVFSMGRLIYYKGFEFLIDAAMYLPQDFIVIIGGSGDLYQDLQNRIKNKGLNEKVKLLGSISFDEVSEFYRRADLFCLPSIEKSEAFGVVLIEAMSFSCPIVTTKIPGSGVPWVNKEGKTGFNVTPKSPFKLAEAIISVFLSPKIYDKFSKKANKRYKKKFQLSIMVEKTINLYKDVF